MMNNPVKCYIYTRVSTAMQVDGFSLEAQKDKLRKYAALNDMEIVREYSDAGFSGKNIKGRADFQRMLNDVAAQTDDISYVLVFKLSCFGRNAADVLSSLQLMKDYGVNLIGENRVQEMLRKKPDLHLDGVEKHIIGHLQTNKAGQIVGEVDMIQSVDSLKIAKEIGKQSVKKGIVTDVLLEINIGEEESKTGFLTNEFYETVHEISGIEGIHINGLMTIPPICEDNTILCKFFENIFTLKYAVERKKGKTFAPPLKFKEKTSRQKRQLVFWSR